jgi:hypothetical protein
MESDRYEFAETTRDNFSGKSLHPGPLFRTPKLGTCLQ